MQNAILIELNYLAPLSYYSLLLKYPEVKIEACESFVKSSYRNRCEIIGPNGRQKLSIPVEGGRNHNQAYRETKIDYSQDWQRNHWNSIRAAYGRSPYFEHYEHYFEKFYRNHWVHLFDFNFELLKITLKLLNINCDIRLTDEFEKTPVLFQDYRNTNHPNPKKNQSKDFFEANEYIQVFGEKNGFQKNLSIIDLLFNEGPGAAIYLK